jgi:hypothetical protein
MAEQKNPRRVKKKLKHDKQFKPVHGMARTPTYSSWRRMKARCLNTRNIVYASYGGRGISLCERWLKFENFFADMGLRPGLEYSIDRIDNNRGYEPDNCKWSTRSEQQRNKRRYNQYDGYRLAMEKQ